MHPRGFLSSALPVLIPFLLVGPAAGAATVTVRAPAPVICVDGSTGSEVASFSGTHTVTWDDADAVVRCDGHGVEPRDLSAADSSVVMLPGRKLVLRLPEPQAVAVEWIAIENDEPRVLASRSFEKSKELTVPVAKDQRRWLRIRRDDSSPVTLAVPTGDDAAVDVPKALAGGEIFGRLPQREFMPKSMATFPETRTAGVNERFFSLYGVRPGAFTLREIYAGGIARHMPGGVVVKKGESVWVDIEHSRPVGAIRAQVSEELCGGGGALLLITGDGVLAESVLDPEVCAHTWEGVPTESVTVRFRHPEEGTVASVDVDVVEDRSDDVMLTRNTPVVRGRVFIGGKLAPEARLRFQGTGEKVDVDADLDGRYEARLPAAGSWHVGGFFTEFAGVRGEPHEFVAGEQEVDIDLPGGRIVVRIRAEGPKDRAFAQFYLRGTRSATTIVRLNEPVDIAGLPLGPYTVEASASGVGISDPAALELTENDPVAEVTLELLSSDIFFTVLEPGGLPVRGARVSVGAGSYDEVEPGLFLLNEVRDGSLARVRAPGFEPLCALARKPRTAVVLRPSGAQTARFLTGKSDFGFAIRGFLGSDCWFMQSDVQWRYVPGGFEIQGLNPGRYTLSLQRKRFDFDVPGAVVDLDAE